MHTLLRDIKTARNWLVKCLCYLKWRLYFFIIKNQSDHGDNIDLVYINLNSRSDRKARLERHLKKFKKLKYSRFAAIEYDSNSQNLYRDILNRGTEDYLDTAKELPRKAGVIGCYLSHIQCINNIERNTGYTLIIEDDISIRKHFFAVITLWCEKIQHNWDIILFDCRGAWYAQDCIGRNIFRPTKTFPFYWGAHAMLINNKRKSHILAILESYRISDIDGLLLENKTAIETLVIRSGMCEQNVRLGSDVTPIN